MVFGSPSNRSTITRPVFRLRNTPGASTCGHAVCAANRMVPASSGQWKSFKGFFCMYLYQSLF